MTTSLPESEAVRVLLSQERVVAVHSALVRLTGSLTAGVFLSQLLYWTPRAADNDHWVYKTRSQWEEETFLSRREIETARSLWRELGILEELQPQGIDRTISYRVSFDALTSRLMSPCEPMQRSHVTNATVTSGTLEGSDLTDVHYAEITTETTTENIDVGLAALGRIWMHYRDAIQPGSRVKAYDQIKRRLKRFSEAELFKAIDNFKGNDWWMEHNAHRGAQWFFQSDQRIEGFLLMTAVKNGTMSANGQGSTHHMDIRGQDWSVEEGYLRALDLELGI